MFAFEPYLNSKQEAELKRVAETIVSPGKGILAADELSTIGKYKIEDNEETRRRYREMLFTAGNIRNELAKYISGVIMFDETFYQKDSNGVPFVKVNYSITAQCEIELLFFRFIKINQLLFLKMLTNKGIIIGIKIDKGLVPLAGTLGEQATQGTINFLLLFRPCFYDNNLAILVKAIFTDFVVSLNFSLESLMKNRDIFFRKTLN